MNSNNNSTVSPSARLALERLARELAASKRNPMTLSEFGDRLSSDFFDSPETLAKYVGKDHAWVTRVKNVFIANYLTTEVNWWTAFPSSACRQRSPIVVGPAAPSTINNLNL